MQNYTTRQLRTLMREGHARGAGLCRSGLFRLLSYPTVGAAFAASTQPGWMRVLLKKVLWRLMTPQEQSAVDAALASTGITASNGYVDEAKADELRAALPGFFT